MTDTPAETIENYNLMVDEMNEQLKRGDLSEVEYRNCLGAVRMMIEKAKIKEFQALKKDSIKNAPLLPFPSSKDDVASCEPWSSESPFSLHGSGSENFQFLCSSLE